MATEKGHWSLTHANTYARTEHYQVRELSYPIPACTQTQRETAILSIDDTLRNAFQLLDSVDLKLAMAVADGESSYHSSLFTEHAVQNVNRCSVSLLCRSIQTWPAFSESVRTKPRRRGNPTPGEG